MVTPTFEEILAFPAIAGRIPVWCDTIADTDTPLSIYWKVSQDEDYSFLLESVTGGEQLARYSLIGVRPSNLLRCDPTGIEDPLELMRRMLPCVDAGLVPGLPKFIGGAVGMLSYDYVRRLEPVNNPPPDDLKLPEVAMMMVETVIVFDHAKNSVKVISSCERSQDSYDRACQEIQRLLEIIRAPLPKLPETKPEVLSVANNRSQSDFETAVETIKDYIVAGDGIQVVPSVRLECETSSHPLTVYRALRSLNPSPYMYLMRFGDFDIVGASPELLVSLHGQTAAVRPIAGTRSRGKDLAEDDEMAASLLGDEKERAEHAMLVDLGRNDLGRVSETGSVKVHDLMSVERYSHVMHIVSSVTGRLKQGLDATDLVRATFPAGTVTGAPKVRAMQIIDELEPTRRGLYGGAVGYFSVTGDMDLAIAIRTILMKSGKAYVQAGAGIVFDSIPQYEWEECLKKARACVRALELAADWDSSH